MLLEKELSKRVYKESLKNISIEKREFSLLHGAFLTTFEKGTRVFMKI
jgi:hypothetical protein